MSGEPCEIRPFAETDQAAVVALWKDVFGYAAPLNDPLAIIEHKRAVQQELFWVAYVQGRLVGTVMAGYDGHRGWLYSLAVDPEMRRRGIGTALMKHAEQALHELGCPKINLQVVASNSAIVEVYTKLGYAIEDRVSLGKILRADAP